MINNIWSIVCANIIIDSRTNLVSYINCLEELSTPKLPVIVPMISIGTLWERSAEGEDLAVRISLETPSGTRKEIFKNENMVMEKMRHRVNIEIGGLAFEEAGTYNFIIENLDKKSWKAAKRIPIHINKINK
jgi:hypothetical protein